MTTPSKTKRENSPKRSKKSPPSLPSSLPRKSFLSPLTRRFLRRVQNTAHTFALWEKGDALVVGVSGGGDSLCLLDVLVLLSRKYTFTLHIAHVNYHLRGGASERDEARVRKAAKQYHLPCTVLSFQQKSGHVPEEKLREIRYAFFEKVRRKSGANSIVVAHHADDQAETLLLRLLRGAGLAGLAAMRPKTDSVIRPLIEISRADILSYLKERRIAFQQDQSNMDLRYLRNRIRHTLLPFLAKNFQPQIHTLLAETALLLGDDYALLEQQSTAFSFEQDPLGTKFSRSALLRLPVPLCRRELRMLLRPLLAGKNPSKHLINEIIKMLKSDKGKVQTITFKGLKFVRKGDIVRLLHF